MSAWQQYLDSDQGWNILSHVAAGLFLRVTSSYLTARFGLLLCIDVDGGLVDTGECIVPWIVTGGMTFFFLIVS